MNSAISTAAFIISRLYDENTNAKQWIEMDADVFMMALEKWKKPSRRTLLHEYISYQYTDSQNYQMDKQFPVGVIQEMQKLFKYYEVDYSEIGFMDTESLEFDDYSDELESYAEKLQIFFIDNLLDTVVEDAFTVLFSDKNFLHEFNSQCAEIILKLKYTDYPDYLKKDGEIQRETYYPTWFKSGIEYRDKLRCSICGCDLSNAFTTIVDENFDHIIPLHSGGNNDPTNWQLTCESCNKSKGARSSSFKNIVFPFWENK